MVNMLRCACRIAAFAIFAGQYSCIDKQYDLSDLDTDDVTIGNELTLPLGTGIIAAGDIVHIEDNEEITVDDAGNYVARYSGEIGVDMPGEIGIGESCFSESRLDIPLAPAGSPYDYPEDAEIELGESPVGLDLATSNIVRLDSVLFDNRNGASRLELKLSSKTSVSTTGTRRWRSARLFRKDTAWPPKPDKTETSPIPNTPARSRCAS